MQTEEGVTVRQGKGAFYNPAQVVNRTLTIRVVNAYLREAKEAEAGAGSSGVAKVLECMSATGLRGIRYCKELHGRNHVVMNDISAQACEEIIANCKNNGIGAELGKATESEKCIAEVANEDCRVLMLKNPRSYDVIDVDPFGTCAPFVEAAVEGIKNGGLLCVTSTDVKVLCDKPPESSFKHYGSITNGGPFAHEIAIRVILSYISRAASRCDKYIIPLVSLSVDFFVRVFVSVHHDKKRSNSAATNNAMFFMCKCLFTAKQSILDRDGDAYRHAKLSAERACRLCGRKVSIHGPLWSGPLHSKTFLERVMPSLDPDHIATKTGGNRATAFTSEQVERRIHGMLSMAMEEMPTPFYYPLPYACSVLSLPVPRTDRLLSFLEHNGHSASLTHCKPNSVKTAAAPELIYAGIIEYFRGNSKVFDRFVQHTLTSTTDPVPRAIFAYLKSHFYGDGKFKVDFTITPTAKQLTSRRYLRFQDRSGLAWGPKKR